MKRVIKIIKAFGFMGPSGYNWLLPVSTIFTGLMSIVICFQITSMVHNYVTRGTTIWFSNIVLQILNLINLSYIFILNAQGITRWKGKVTGNLNNFFIQAPLLKKDIYNAKFAIFQVASTPFLIVVIYFIGLNIFVSTDDLISAYSGFLILIYCIWTMTLSISIGFSSLSCKKYKAFRYLFPVLLFISVVFLIYLSSISYGQSRTIVNEKNMFSALGPTFIPILKACRHIGGIAGLIIILVSTIISYFLGCKLPLKISEKVGA
jgi:hypothetical protein